MKVLLYLPLKIKNLKAITEALRFLDNTFKVFFKMDV